MGISWVFIEIESLALPSLLTTTFIGKLKAILQVLLAYLRRLAGHLLWIGDKVFTTEVIVRLALSNQCRSINRQRTPKLLLLLDEYWNAWLFFKLLSVLKKLVG